MSFQGHIFEAFGLEQVDMQGELGLVWYIIPSVGQM